MQDFTKATGRKSCKEEYIITKLLAAGNLSMFGLLVTSLGTLRKYRLALLQHMQLRWVS